LIGTVARTAVVAGTATATAGAVNRHQAKKAAEKQAYADEQAAEQQAYQAPPPPAYQPPPPAYQPPPPAYQPPPPAYQAPAPEPAAGGDDDLVSQIAELAKLRDSGVLSDAEFSAAKGKLLGL